MDTACSQNWEWTSLEDELQIESRKYTKQIQSICI